MYIEIEIPRNQILITIFLVFTAYSSIFNFDSSHAPSRDLLVRLQFCCIYGKAAGETIVKGASTLYRMPVAARLALTQCAASSCVERVYALRDGTRRHSIGLKMHSDSIGNRALG